MNGTLLASAIASAQRGRKKPRSPSQGNPRQHLTPAKAQPPLLGLLGYSANPLNHSTRFSYQQAIWHQSPIRSGAPSASSLLMCGYTVGEAKSKVKTWFQLARPSSSLRPAVP
jgi:hypothetical protein